MNKLYKIIGISKQAVYQNELREKRFLAQMNVLLLEADELRREHPGCGIEKMYYTLAPTFIGRDNFVEAFMKLGYRIIRQRNYQRTTFSTKHYYPNLIEGMLLDAPSQLWQSDITYLGLNQRHYYAVFITDVFTRKVVGYHVSDSLRATANVQAFKKAILHNQPPSIHHSDRGSQYIYHKYIEILIENKCKISMGLTAQDNAYAERLHRTIKEEYLDYWTIKDFKDLKRRVAKVVLHYNTKRKHNSLGRRTPIQFEENYKNINPKPTMVIFEPKIIN